jgi:8-amino-7-oxononanoate synthase
MLLNKNNEQFLVERLQERSECGALRQLSLVSDLNLVDFCSNDYLGLSRRLAAGSSQHSSYGSTGSRLLSGNSTAAVRLESQLAKFHQAEAALVFNSGYDANLGLCSALGRRGDVMLYDQLVHASIRDGVRLSSAKSYSFAHNDLDDLRAKISRLGSAQRIFVLVESLYSMDGDFAPIQELCFLSKELGFYLIVDEAHALGVVGNCGEGLVQSLGLQELCFARVYTFGKALGCHGATVVGSDQLKQYLVNFARSFIYTTALAPEAYQRISAGYDLLPALATERAQLSALINEFDTLAQQAGFPLVAAGSSIKSLVFSGNTRVKAISQVLKENGLDVRAILSPTVPVNQERLRVCLHCFNNIQQIQKLISILRTVS